MLDRSGYVRVTKIIQVTFGLASRCVCAKCPKRTGFESGLCSRHASFTKFQSRTGYV